MLVIYVLDYSSIKSSCSTNSFLRTIANSSFNILHSPFLPCNYVLHQLLSVHQAWFFRCGQSICPLICGLCIRKPGLVGVYDPILVAEQAVEVFSVFASIDSVVVRVDYSRVLLPVELTASHSVQVVKLLDLHLHKHALVLFAIALSSPLKLRV